MLWLELPVWETVMVVALWGVAITGAAVAVSTYSVILLQRQEATERSDEFAQYRVEAAERTAKAEEAAAKANADVAIANEKIAAANERAAVLGKEAEAARLETEKLKSLTAWRAVTPAVSAVLIASLSTHPGAVHIKYVANDAETAFFALQLATAFERAYWKVSSAPTMYSEAFVFGLFVPGTNEGSVKDIRDTFNLAGIGFFTANVDSGFVTFSGNGVRFGTAPQPEGTLIIVGPRKPVF